jgi:hypothetical protein
MKADEEETAEQKKDDKNVKERRQRTPCLTGSNRLYCGVSAVARTRVPPPCRHASAQCHPSLNDLRWQRRERTTSQSTRHGST